MQNRINGSEYPLAKIFSSDFDFIIPSYQRPYAWSTDQTSELFEDLYDFFERKEEDSYFLGSIVLIKEREKPYSEVIDGQQRLTTLTILLASITANLAEDYKKDFKNYIMESGRPSQGIASKPRLTLRERDKDFFTHYIQELNLQQLITEDPARFENESQRHIQQNTKLILSQLESKFENNKDKLFEFGSFLIQRCFLVTVSTPNQQSAFRVFSVLNNRGLDLLPSDIIKADIIGKIDLDRQNEFTERWEELEVQTGRNGFNELLNHIRMIYTEEKVKRSLIEEFKQYILDKSTSNELVIEEVLEPYTKAFVTIKSQQYKSTDHAVEINKLFMWLTTRIDYSDWLPPAILFLSQNNNSSYTLWFLSKLERLTAYLHLCEKNINQRIKRYAELIKDLKKEHSLNNPIPSIELSVNEIKEFKKVLDSNIYEMTARRRNYLILRLDSFISDGAATYNPNLLTIEHVLPQTVSIESDWQKNWPDKDKRKEWVHRIANLVPLTQKRNSKASNLDFKTKKIKYFTGKSNVSSYALTTQVLNTENWTPEVLQQRQKNLLDILFKNWDLYDNS